jgi:hypothetical protein
MRRFAMVVLAGVTACGTTPDAAPSGPDPAAGFSATAAPIIDVLAANHGSARGVTWDVSSDNTLDGNWLIQTPPEADWTLPTAQLPVATPCAGSAGCDPDFDLIECHTQADCIDGGTCTPVHATVTAPGVAPRSLCVGHSDAFVDQIYDLVTTATERVDISSLEPPDGRFTAALHNAFAYLAADGRAITARYIYGVIPGSEEEGATLPPDQVVALLAPPAGSVELAVAAYRDGPQSWDHAKIVAIDGRTALVGGHNLLTRDYLQRDPVHDLSMQVTGTAAAHATALADALWRFACNPGLGGLASTVTVVRAPGAGDPCQQLGQAVTGAPGSGTTRIISVGRLGAIGDNAGDDAMLALIGAAHTSLRISQQDIGGLGGVWPQPIVAALDAAVARGVDVQFVMSNVNAFPDGENGFAASYSNGWTPTDVMNALAAASTNMSAALCQHFAAAGLQHAPDAAWPDGVPMANHAKLAVADDAVAYIGSNNLYPANLAEHGFIIDDAAAVAQINAHYFTPLWTASQKSAVSGPSAASCALH